jgi:uncharacterized membrane protein YraQ (UPF0718 family)
MGICNISYAIKSLTVAKSNIITMLGVIPPIFILIGLLDVWIPKETMIKYMGDNSGITGLLLAFMLGTMAAGPLYAAFPIAGLLLKKGAKFSYVIFFLGTWNSAKLPLLLFEMTSLGVKFTVVHVITMLVLYLIGSVLIDKMISKKYKEKIIMSASKM